MKPNRKILISIIVILAVTNISTVGTIIYHKYYGIQKNCKEEKSEKIEIPDTGLGRFFKEELNLNYEQHMQFRTFRQNFHFRANKITGDMQLLRNEMLEELKKEKSDTVYLHKLARDLGDLHTELKHLTFEYYLEMKSVCSPEQQEKLYEIFNAMMNGKADLKMPSGRKQNMDLRKLK